MNATMYESGEYLEANPDWHAGDAPHKARWIGEILRRNKLDPKSVVEVGSGAGELLVNLSRAYPQARMDGYEISPQAHAIAGPKSGGRLNFHLANYFEVEAEKPDIVMAIDVFEHVEDYMGFIRGLTDKGTWKLFHIPLDLSVQGLLRGKSMMHARRVVGHLHYFCRDTALATLRDCGLEVVDWNYNHGAETRPKGGLRTKVFNVPRKLVRLVNEDFAVRVMGGASMMVLTR
jgi:cyclopropane fatty-acyl-phospholipid synthase-like methyltransferase